MICHCQPVPGYGPCTCPVNCTQCKISPPRATYDPLGRPQEFVDDWNAMIGKVSDFFDKYQLPKPEIIIHPKVHVTMNAIAHEHILGTLIWREVKVRTGRFEQATVLREN